MTQVAPTTNYLQPPPELTFFADVRNAGPKYCHVVSMVTGRPEVYAQCDGETWAEAVAKAMVLATCCNVADRLDRDGVCGAFMVGSDPIAKAFIELGNLTMLDGFQRGMQAFADYYDRTNGATRPQPKGGG